MLKREIASWPVPAHPRAATNTYFDTVISAPVSQPVEERELTWYQHAIEFNDMKWPFLQCGSRRSYAECLATVTAGIVTSEVGAPNPRTLFRALASWSFNKTAREAGPPPCRYTDAISWIEKHSRPLTDLLDPRIARAAFATTLTSVEGRPYSTKTRRNKRSVLVSALNYAVELELIDRNPMDRIREAVTWRTAGVDRRCVVNPEQARSLLDAVATQPPLLSV